MGFCCGGNPTRARSVLVSTALIDFPAPASTSFCARTHHALATVLRYGQSGEGRSGLGQEKHAANMTGPYTAPKLRLNRGSRQGTLGSVIGP